MGAIHGHHGLLLAGTVAAWTPASLTVAPKLWINDSSVVTDAGSGACSQWNDISGSAWHVSQATGGKMPTILAGDKNGRRTIQCDGSTDILQTSASAAKDIFRNVSAGWVFLVFKRAATGAGTRVLFGASQGGAVGASRLRFDINSEKIRVASGRVDGVSSVTMLGGTSIDTNWHAAMITMDWAASAANIYLDGASDGSGSLDSSGTTSSTASLAPLSVGCNMDDAAAWFDGKIAEIVVGAGSLPSTGERSSLFAYAVSRWGL